MRINITCHGQGPCPSCSGCDAPPVDLRHIWDAPKKENGKIAHGVSLTPREHDAGRTLHMGLKQASRALGISTGTLKVHRNNLFRKLGKSGREAMRVLNGVAL